MNQRVQSAEGVVSNNLKPIYLRTGRKFMLQWLGVIEKKYLGKKDFLFCETKEVYLLRDGGGLSYFELQIVKQNITTNVASSN